MKLCSACLLGIKCMWNGQSKPTSRLIKLFKKGELVPVCCEQLGGLPTPRTPSGIFNTTGLEVINGKGKVVNKKGEDVTRKFLKGSQEILKIAQKLEIREAILKKTSPACGVGKTWQMRKINGKYKNYLVNGDGVLTALLKANGLKIYSEREI